MHVCSDGKQQAKNRTSGTVTEVIINGDAGAVTVGLWARLPSRTWCRWTWTNKAGAVDYK